MTITKDICIGELLTLDPGIYPILAQTGMHCIGCPSSAMEMLEEACAVHGIDPDPIVDAINALLKK